MTKTASLALVSLCLTACGRGAVDQADLLGRWTWAGQDCAAQNLEFTRDAIYVTAADGDRGILFKVLPGEHRTSDPLDYMLHLKQLARPGMSPELRRTIESGGGRHSLLLRLEGDRIRPVAITRADGVRALTSEDYAYQLFDVSRCA